jgi:hypothetical protein
MMDALLVLGGAVLSGLAMYFFGYRKAGRVRSAQQTEHRLKDVRTAQGVREDVEALDDVGLAKRAAKWLHED